MQTITLEEWLDRKLKEYESDLEFQREKLLYILGERIAAFDSTGTTE